MTVSPALNLILFCPFPQRLVNGQQKPQGVGTSLRMLVNAAYFAYNNLCLDIIAKSMVRLNSEIACSRNYR